MSYTFKPGVYTPDYYFLHAVEVMDLLAAFLHGFLLALGLILPLGVQNVFVFNQGVFHRSWFRALPVVVIAGTCDTLLILVAVLGVSVLVLNLAWLKILLTILGVSFLLYMAVSTWNNPVANLHGNAEEEQWTFSKQVVFAASASLLNPHAIVDTIGVIGTSSLAYLDAAQKFSFTLATILVSWIWFFGLMSLGHVIGGLPNALGLQRIINKISALIMVFSAVLLIKTVI